MSEKENLMEGIEDLLSVKEAATQWFLNDSTIRKAIGKSGKSEKEINVRFEKGIDCIKIGQQWLVSKKAMEREFGKMKITGLSSELQRQVIDLILEDRLASLNENIKNGHVEDGYEFVLRDLFDQGDWRGVAIWPGNWRLGTPFSKKITKDYKYIERKGDKAGAALYKIDLSKY